MGTALTLPRFPRWIGGALIASAVLLSAGAQAKTYEVQKGDSLWGLAKRFGVAVEAIKSANGLKSDGIRWGQKLKIPGKTPAQKNSAAKAKPKTSKPSSAKPSAPPKPKATSRPTTQRATSKQASPSKDNIKATPAKPSSPRRIPQAQQEAAVALYSKDTPRSAPDSLAERAPAWVLAPPPDRTQVRKSIAARGGVYPCSVEDNGFGSYQHWTQVAPMAHVLMPTHIQLGEEGQFDVVFHFHGREPIRKEWVTVMKNAVLVAIDIGIDSGSYTRAFDDPRTFRQVLRAVEQHVVGKSGNSQAHAQRVGLSAWSAGYGAVERILAQPFGKQVVDSVILLDGLHSGYTAHALDAQRLAPFVEFAERAQRGDKLMFISHSSIRTTGYASTTETAQYLTWRLGGKPQDTSPVRSDPMGLERIRTYSDGNFHMRGFAGNAAADHCAHIALMSDVLRVHIKPRWSQPVPTHLVRNSTPSRLALHELPATEQK